MKKKNSWQSILIEGILALLIEYVEAGILNIESDADNMARQRIPITKAGQNFSWEEKKHLPKIMPQFPATRGKKNWRKKHQQYPLSTKPTNKNTPSLLSCPTRPMPGMSTWHFSRSPGSNSHGRATHFFMFKIWDANGSVLASTKKKPS